MGVTEQARELVSAIQCGHLGAPGLELRGANTGRDGFYFMAFTMEWARRTLDTA